MVDVNDFINEYPYATDQETYGVSEYWASLKEFVLHGKGDCEDYAIAKMEILKVLGINPDNMNIGIKKVDGTFHAVLLTIDRKDRKLKKTIDIYEIK